MTSATIMLYANPETCEPTSGAAALAKVLADRLDTHLSIILPCHSVLPPSWEGRSTQEIEQEVAKRLQRSTALAKEIATNARRENVSVSTQEFVLGGATRGILDRPRLPVMLSH